MVAAIDDIERYLEQHQDKELLRLVTVGSVDDGKSTLIGRLLHDCHGIYEDQLSAVKRASRGAENIDFSLFTDGLKAEREQGITIDVAYRHFSTDKRKFIIADTPGHVQYTRNMATGASTANVAVILIDARLGVLQQSRRHAYIAALLGIPHLAVCVNKMDLVAFSREVFEQIKSELSDLSTHLGFKDATFFPVSAVDGDNIVHPSARAPWHEGGTLLEFLETVPIADDKNLDDFRFPVQVALRPDLDYRGFCGQIASGRIDRGDAVVVLPSGRASRVVAIDTFDGERATAAAPESVTLRLADEIDVSRGDMIVRAGNLPEATLRFDAMLVWMSERPLDRDKSYLIKHTTRLVRAQIAEVAYSTDLETLDRIPRETLELNDIGRVTVVCHQPLFVDPYVDNRGTGAFIVIDSLTNNTVAAGMIVGTDEPAARGAGAGEPHTQVSAAERAERLGQQAAVVVLGCRSSRAQSARLAFAVERRLFDRGNVVTVLPGDDAAPELVRALVAAGLLVIVAGAPATDLGDVHAVDVDTPASGDDEEAAADVVNALIERGVLWGRSSGVVL